MVVTEDISRKTLDILDKINIPYILKTTDNIKNLVSKMIDAKMVGKYIKALVKLEIFSLVQFDKCVFLDSDLVLYHNIDDLFDKPEWSAVEDCLPVHKRPKEYKLGESSFCSGLFVFKPSIDFYNKIMTGLESLPANIKWHDQNILAYYNQDWMGKSELHLPAEYDLLIAMQEDVYNTYINQGGKDEDIKVKHFVTYKNAPYDKESFLENNVYFQYIEYYNYINNIIEDYNIDLKKVNIENILPMKPTNKSKTKEKYDFNEPIDYVFPFVDNKEAVWLKSFKDCCLRTHNTEKLKSVNGERYEDLGLLKYLLKAIEKNLPWIRKIHLIVSNEEQVPSWVDRNKVNVVLHKDIIPAKYLPTFNSTTIEMYIRRIPDLAEYFIYGNDDMYPLNPLEPSEFFTKDGKIKLDFECRKRKDVNQFDHVCYNNYRDVLKGLGKHPEDNLFLKPVHGLTPMIKSHCWECAETLGSLLFTDNITPFRNGRQHNQYIYPLWEKYKYGVSYTSLNFKYVSMVNGLDAICSAILNEENDVLCFNDCTSSNRGYIIRNIDLIKNCFRERLR